MQMLFWIIDLKLLKIGVAVEELLMVGDPSVVSWLEADGDNCTPDLTNSANDASLP